MSRTRTPTTTSALVAAEVVKLRRSASWVVVVGLPLAVVALALLTTLASGEPLEEGWRTLWLRTAVFHGLFPLSVGVGLLASLVWRVEHRHGWNALRCAPASTLQVAVAKAAVVTGLAWALQLAFLASVLVAGAVLLDLPGGLPAHAWTASGVLAVALVPVAAAQSLLSLLWRSFAAPVLAALLSAGASAALLLAAPGPALLLPQALVARASQLGTGAFADTGHVTAGTIAFLLAASLASAVVVIVLTAAVLERREATGG